MRKIMVLLGALSAGMAQASEMTITVLGQANGDIVIDLLEDIAPLHVERIRTLANEGAYDNVVFHRVIDGFMAQTGTCNLERPLRTSVERGMVDHNYLICLLSFQKCPMIAASSAWHSQSPNSANSQFFIMFEPGYFLNGQYTVVGRVTSGMEVVDAIKRGRGSNGAVTDVPDSAFDRLRCA